MNSAQTRSFIGRSAKRHPRAKAGLAKLLTFRTHPAMV